MKSTRLAWLCGLLLAVALVCPSPAATDVAASADRLPMTDSTEWCLTSRDLRREQLGPETCSWAPMNFTESRRGFEDRAVWLRLQLRNSSAQPIERWIEVGHQRLSSVELQYPSATGQWITATIGVDVPLAKRSVEGRRYGVIPVTVAANSDVDVLIRVQTDSLMVLDTVLWAPDALRDHRIGNDIWLTLAVGALLLVIIFSMTMFVVSREVQYALLALGLIGEAIIETVRTGFMLRYFWPETWVFPLTMTTLGGMCLLIGFFSYFRLVILTRPNESRLYRLLEVWAGAVLIAQLYTIFIDYSSGTLLWSALVMPLLLLLGWACAQAVRRGERFAYWIFLTFVIMGMIGVLRLSSVTQRLPASLADETIAPIATVVVAVLVMMSIIERARQLQRELSTSQIIAAAQVSFLARMSHELRTPLDTVLGNAQLLMRPERRGGESSGGESPELASILRSGRHLLGMVDEILDYARGVAGALQLRTEPVAPQDFLLSVDTVARILALRNRNRFELRDVSPAGQTPPKLLRLDAGRLRQVLDNLLANAARHTQDGSIRLNYGFAPAGAGRWRMDFEILDSGEGIAEEDQSRIFQPFERVGRGARYGGKGAGMGLAVARQLVELMGGELTVDSALARGSTFRFSILADEVEGEAPESVRPGVDLREVIGYTGARRRVLVVDDDSGGRAVISGLLRSIGFEVNEAEGGNEAARMLLADGRYDLVVTDQFMPEGDGWRVLETVQRLDPLLPCVLISAAPPSPPDYWPTESRFAACFLKPLDHEGFLHIVGNLLGMSWIRASEPAPAPDIRALQRPGAAELAELHEMIEFGEVTAIIEWAQRLRHRVPECSAFVDQLEAAATDLDFVTLKNLAELDRR